MATTRQPNILFFLTDQQRADSLGCMGNTVCLTPNIDRLAASGTLFANHHVNNPVCMPSRATLMTGLTPRGHGVRCNGIPLDIRATTLPSILAANGYTTYNAGKVHLQNTMNPPGIDPVTLPAEYAVENKTRWGKGVNVSTPDGYYGFGKCEIALGHGASIAGDYGCWMKREHPDVLERLQDDGRWLTPSSGAPGCHKWAIPQELHHSSWVADRTIDFLRNRRSDSNPFFAVCSFPDPHHPFTPPAPWCDKYGPATVTMPSRREGELDLMPEHYRQFTAMSPGASPGEKVPMIEAHLRETIALTYGTVSLIDHNVGRVLAELERLGLTDSTVVVFTSDHGEMLGDHWMMAKGPYLYRSLTRVPLIVRDPRHGAGATCTSITSHLDIVPTLLARAGVDYPDREWYQTQNEGKEGPALPGRSLNPILAGAATRVRDRALVEFDRDRLGMRLRSLVTEDFRVTMYSRETFGELFDLRDDPGEFRNLWDDPDGRDLKQRALAELLHEEVSTESNLPRRRSCY